jgi:hypothetical protein
MLTVLMVDDDTDLTATVKSYAEEVLQGVNFRSQSDFNAAMQSLQDTKPDVLILDVYRGNPATGDAAVQPVWSRVWRDWFCPLVFYSADEVAVADPSVPDHPFIRVVAKGANSERQVVEHIKAFASHTQALRAAVADIERLTHIVLRDVAVPVFGAENDETKRRDMLVRATRRRVAALMDEMMALTEQRLFGWEQYIFPALASHPVVGDILRVTVEDRNNPRSYRVLLTPTCDMVPQTSGCKVTHVLLGKCDSPECFITKGLSLAKNTSKSKLKERLPAALNEPHQSGVILLPACPQILPLMALNLRDLELMPLTDIVPPQGQEARLTRIASLDSPFREFVGWAYLQISCRPGVPPRDNSAAIESILKEWNPPATEGKK